MASTWWILWNLTDENTSPTNPGYGKMSTNYAASAGMLTCSSTDEYTSTSNPKGRRRELFKTDTEFIIFTVVMFTITVVGIVENAVVIHVYAAVKD